MHLNQLHKGCNSRIKYQKVCPEHGEQSTDNIVSGYEHTKGQYVVIDPDEVDKLRTKTDRAVSIDGFVPADAVDARYYAGKTWYLLPDGIAGERPYALMHRGMLDNDVVAIASAEHEKMARKRAAAIPTAAPGSSSDVIAAGVPLPDAVAVDDKNVYWMSTTSGAIQAAPRVGGPAVTLTKGHKMLFPRHSQVLAVAGGNVYFATRDGRGYGAILRVPAGGGDAEPLTADLEGITSVAARGKDVVFTRAATGASRDPDGNPTGGLYRVGAKGEEPKLLVPLERPCASALDGKAAFAKTLKDLEKNVSDLQKLLEIRNKDLSEQQKQAEQARKDAAAALAAAKTPTPSRT